MSFFRKYAPVIGTVVVLCFLALMVGRLVVKFLPILIGGGVLAFFLLRLNRSQHGGGWGRSEFLCDTCTFDYGNACTRPERPNATRCPDYERGKSYPV